MLRRLERQVRDAVAAHLGRPPQILTWGRTLDEQWCIALPDRLVWGADADWRELLWHEVERGGWNAELAELRWTDLDQKPGSVRLARPGKLPEVFADRVNATIAARVRIPIEGTEDGIVVSGRRDLTDPDAPLRWLATPMRGTRMTDPQIAALAAAAVARVRAEYD